MRSVIGFYANLVSFHDPLFDQKREAAEYDLPEKYETHRTAALNPLQHAACAFIDRLTNLIACQTNLT